MKVIVAVSALLCACNAFSFKQMQVSFMEPLVISRAITTDMWNKTEKLALYALLASF